MRVALIAIQIALAALPAASQDALTRLTDTSTAAALRTGGPATRSIAGDGVLDLVPGVTAQSPLAVDMRAFRPSVGVEYARLIPGRAPARAADWLRIYNTLHAASTMEGVTYWSVSEGRRDVLFVQSYAVDSLAGRHRVADPVAARVPAASTFFTFQEDHSFGKNVYGEEFRGAENRMEVKIENLTTISLLFVPVIGPRSFVVRIVLVPAGSDLLFYGAAAIRSSFPIGDRRSREESLSNRLTAMTDWLAAALAKPAAP
jgi:hypothetical protein